MAFPTITAVILVRFHINLVSRNIDAVLAAQYTNGDVTERTFILALTDVQAAAAAAGRTDFAAADVGTVSETASGLSPVTIFVPEPVATLQLNALTNTLKVGDTDQCNATPRDVNGNVLDRLVTWSSSDLTIATVDSHGLVTGVAAGDVVITATCEGVSNTDTLTVTA